MDSVHPFIQTGICFRAQICCMLRLNCLKAARRKADHLLKQTREIIGIAKANILSPQEPKVQWFAAVQVRTECGHSCDILCGSAIRKVLNVFSRFCQALDIKTALYRGSGMRPFLFWITNAAICPFQGANQRCRCLRPALTHEQAHWYNLLQPLQIFILRQAAQTINEQDFISRILLQP